MQKNPNAAVSHNVTTGRRNIVRLSPNTEVWMYRTSGRRHSRRCLLRGAVTYQQTNRGAVVPPPLTNTRFPGTSPVISFQGTIPSKGQNVFLLMSPLKLTPRFPAPPPDESKCLLESELPRLPTHFILLWRIWRGTGQRVSDPGYDPCASSSDARVLSGSSSL